MIASQAQGMLDRIEKGKQPPGFESAECHCRFFRNYMLPCKHLLHEHCFSSNKLLTTEVWLSFQLMFEENGLSIYEKRERIEIPTQNEAEEDRAESRRVQVNELLERVRDRYWSIEGKGDVNATNDFISNLGASLSDIIDQQ